MEFSLVKSGISFNFPSSNRVLTLQQSIDSLLADIREGTVSMTRYRDTFYELMQLGAGTSLESIWMYAAVNFRTHNIPNGSYLEQLVEALELFRLVSACSATCCSWKSIALLAPVMFKLHGVVAELMRKDLTSKREKRAFREAKSLIDVILGYMNTCWDDWNEEINYGCTMHTSVANLVRVWIELDEPLESFFPLVGDEIFRELNLEECDVLRLTGAVITEGFLLKLLLNLKDGISKPDLEDELRNWIVGSITCFGNIYLFGNLLTILLEDTLPFASLITSEDEILLRKVLYDSAVLVDYSFLTNDKALHLPAKQMASLAMKRLIVIHAGLEFSRQHGDQKRVLSYINAFSDSSLATQIMRSFASEAPVEEPSIRSSPIMLIQWLLKLEEKEGIQVFDDAILKFRSILVDFVSDIHVHPSMNKLKGANEDLLFYIDSKGEEESVEKGEDEMSKESMSLAFITAAQTLTGTEKSSRKRKDGRGNGKKKDFKYIKYDLSQAANSATPGEEFDNRSMSSDSEVENPLDR